MMITLSEAAKLCRIKEDLLVEFRVKDALQRGSITFTVKQAYERLDMKQIHVHEIYPDIGRDGDCYGMGFVISGISYDDLYRKSILYK